MAFVLCSDITIGGFRFSGVEMVRVKRSIHTLADTAVIKIPSICRILTSAVPTTFTTATIISNQMATYKGDIPVAINLGYNGDLKEEFRGFVKRCDLNTPLEVECEGYIRKLRNKRVSGYYATTTAKKLLALATAGTGINVVVHDDIPFVRVTLSDNTGIEIVEFIRRISQNTLNIFFIDPTTIWCGLTYTAYGKNQDPFETGQVNYRLGYNVVKDNNLKERTTSDNPVQILFNGTLAAGEQVRTVSDNKTAARKDKSILNNIGSEPAMRQLANEKQYRMNYEGYEGSINAFLQPYCLPTYKANVVDARYPQRTGVYLTESTSVTFGTGGARRAVELGPRIGFNIQ